MSRTPSAGAAAFPGGVLAAAILAAERASFLLVGSAALWLRGEPLPVADADAVIEPGLQNLRCLRDALAGLTVNPRQVPSVPVLLSQPLITVTTPYGRVDCLLERGRRDWNRLVRGADVVPVADAAVLVAGAADCWSLRRQFKE